MHTDVLVLDHDPARLRQRRRDIQRLRTIGGRRGQMAAQLSLRAVLGDGEAIDRTNVDAGIALDAQLRREYRLNIAIQAALHLERRLFGGKSEFHLDVDLLESLDESHVRHQTPFHPVVLVLVRPLVHAHLAARQAHSARHALLYGLVMAKLVNRYRGLVSVFDGPDDVLRPECRVAAEKYLRQRGLIGDLVHLGYVPFIQFDADALLDPRKGVFLADGENDVIAGKKDIAKRTRRFDVAVVDVVLKFLEHHAEQFSALGDEGFGRVIDDDGDIFVLGIFEFPLGRLEELARLARHDFHVLGAETQRAAAAVHRGIADADDQDPLTDAVDMAEGNRFEPGDPDMHAIRVVAARQVEFLALGRARADENGIEFFRFEQLAHALHRRVQAQVRAHVHDVADFLVQHMGGKAECRDVGAHQAARYG